MITRRRQKQGISTLDFIAEARRQPSRHRSIAKRNNRICSAKSKGIDIFWVCNFCVGQDIEAIDLTGYFFSGYPTAPLDGYISRIKRYTHDRGITISGTSVNNDFTTAKLTVHQE